MANSYIYLTMLYLKKRCAVVLCGSAPVRAFGRCFREKPSSLPSTAPPCEASTSCDGSCRRQREAPLQGRKHNRCQKTALRLEKLGYVQIVKRQNIPLRFENGALQSRVDLDPCLDAGIGEPGIHSLTIGAFQTRLTAVSRPYEAWKGFMNEDKHIVEARVYLNGSSEHAAAGRGNALVDCGFDFDAADPDIYRFELEWISQDTPSGTSVSNL